MKKYIRGAISAIVIMFPVVTLGAAKYDTIGNALKSITTDILNPLIALIIAIGLVVFLWGVVKYVTAGAD